MSANSTLHSPELFSRPNFQNVIVKSCGFCEKSFYSTSELDKHLLIHTGEKPFTCSVCNKSFRQKAHLTRHNSVHTGLKPFACHVCGKAFARKDKCYEHIRAHEF